MDQQIAERVSRSFQILIAGIDHSGSHDAVQLQRRASRSTELARRRGDSTEGLFKQNYAQLRASYGNEPWELNYGSIDPVMTQSGLPSLAGYDAVTKDARRCALDLYEVMATMVREQCERRDNLMGDN